MNNQAAGWVIVILIVLLVISYAHKVVVYYKKKRGKHRHHPHCPPCPDCPPKVTGLKIDSISVNNNSIILKGKKMSVSLVGKQQVVYNVIPLTTDESGNQVPIDLNLWTLDQLFLPGTIQASISDLSIVTETQNASNSLEVTVVSVDGASGTVVLTVIGQNVAGQILNVTDTISVSQPETTSTSTSTTTTEAPPPPAPLVSGLGLQAGTPTDVV